MIAEVATYIREGQSGVREFSNRRLAPGRMLGWEDCLFHDANGSMKAQVRDWLEGLSESDEGATSVSGLASLSMRAFARASEDRPRMQAVCYELTFCSIQAYFATVQQRFRIYMHETSSTEIRSGSHLALDLVFHRLVAWGRVLDLDSDGSEQSAWSLLEETHDRVIQTCMDLLNTIEKNSSSRKAHLVDSEIDQHIESLWGLLPPDLSRRANDHWQQTMLGRTNDMSAVDELQEALSAPQFTAFHATKALTMMKRIRLAIADMKPCHVDGHVDDWTIDRADVNVTVDDASYTIGCFMGDLPVLVEWMWYIPAWEQVSPDQRSIVMNLRARSFGTNEKAEALMTLDCIGVFQERTSRYGYGFVYSMPDGFVPKPIPLYQLLEHNRRVKKPEPLLG